MQSAWSFKKHAFVVPEGKRGQTFTAVLTLVVKQPSHADKPCQTVTGDFV